MENEKKNNKKIIIALSIIIALLIASFGGYIAYEKYQEKMIREKQELIEDTNAKYESINTTIELLILNEEEQREINEQMEKVKKAIDDENITEETHNVIENINRKIEEIKSNNKSLIEQKETESNGIDISKFNEEQNSKMTEIQNQYNSLKEQQNYKEAQSKIQEVIDYKNNTNLEIAKIEQEETQKQLEAQVQSQTQTKSTSNNKATSSSNPNPQSNNGSGGSNNSTNTTSNPTVSKANITHNIVNSYSVSNVGGKYSGQYIRHYTFSGSVQNNSNVTAIVQVKMDLYDVENSPVLARTETKTIEIAPHGATAVRVVFDVNSTEQYPCVAYRDSVQIISARAK